MPQCAGRLDGLESQSGDGDGAGRKSDDGENGVGLSLEFAEESEIDGHGCDDAIRRNYDHNVAILRTRDQRPKKLAGA